MFVCYSDNRHRSSIGAFKKEVVDEAENLLISYIKLQKKWVQCSMDCR